MKKLPGIRFSKQLFFAPVILMTLTIGIIFGMLATINAEAEDEEKASTEPAVTFPVPSKDPVGPVGPVGPVDPVDLLDAPYVPPPSAAGMNDPFGGRGGAGGNNSADITDARSLIIVGLAKSRSGKSFALIQMKSGERAMLVREGAEIPLSLKGNAGSATVKMITDQSVVLTLAGGDELTIR